MRHMPLYNPTVVLSFGCLLLGVFLLRKTYQSEKPRWTMLSLAFTIWLVSCGFFLWALYKDWLDHHRYLLNKPPDTYQQHEGHHHN